MSESTIQATASAVTHKTIKKKSDGRNMTLYNVETDRGTFSTAKRDLAAEAHRLLNKEARYTIRTEQRGEFTNYYLEAVDELDSAFPQQMPQKKNGSEPVGQPEQPIGTPAPSQADKDLLIHRQTAAKVAAQVSRTPDEFWPNLLDLVHFFQTGETPVGPGQASGAFVPEDAGPPDDDEIPF